MIAALTIARPHTAAGPSLRDFEAYYSAGATWLRGGDAYGTGIWLTERTLPGVDANRYELLPFAGPLATLPVWAAFARLSYPVAAVIWRTILWLSIIVMVCVALTLAGLPRSPFNISAFALAAFGFGAVTNAFALGQIALPVAAAIAVAYSATRFGGKVLAGAAAFAQPNLALALAGEFRRKRTALALIAAVALFGLLCAGVSVNGILTYALVLLAHGAAEQFSAIQLTPASIAFGFGAPSAAAVAIAGVIALAALLVWLRAMTKFDDRFTLFAISCALVPFGAAFFHQHDLVIVFVPALVMVARARSASLSLVMTGALLCAVNWIGIAQNPQATLQTLLLTVAFAAALLAVRGDFGYDALAVPAAVALLIVGAGVFASSHAMPVWPDAMQSLPSGLQTPSASAVWHAEQAATGLFARDAFWSLIRSASLAGCALLICSAFLNARFLKSQSAGLAGTGNASEPELSQ